MLVTRATYSFSKRTSTYIQAGYVFNSVKGNVAIAAGGTGPGYGSGQFGADVGIQHRF